MSLTLVYVIVNISDLWCIFDICIMCRMHLAGRNGFIHLIFIFSFYILKNLSLLQLYPNILQLFFST